MDFLRFGEVLINKNFVKKILKFENNGNFIKLIDMDNKEYLLECINSEVACQIFGEYCNKLAYEDNYKMLTLK